MGILITGFTGFIGSRLCEALKKSRKELRFLSRRTDNSIKNLIACDLTRDNIPQSCFDGISVVFHLAAHTHDKEGSFNNESLYKSLNVNATLKLAQMAIEMNVKKFIFLSSVKAGSPNIYSHNEYLESEPRGAYGASKKEAEDKLLSLAKGTQMQILIIRPALVYGPNVKGNLGLMIEAIKSGWFPPLPEVNNKRSMIHIDDLVNALILIMRKPQKENHIYLLTDGENYSSKRIYDTLYSLMGKKPPKWRLPFMLFKLLALINDSAKHKINKLFESEFYISSEVEFIGFKTRFTLDDMHKKIF